MADLLIKGIRELTGPHTIHVSNVGLNGVKDGFKAWDSAVGCAYEVVEVPAHGRLIDADRLHESMYHRAFETDGDTMWQSGCWVRYRAIEQVMESAATVIEASEDGEQDGKL